MNQISLASMMMHLNVTKEKEPDENLVRHMILNSIRMYRTDFNQEFGEIVLTYDSKHYWRRDYFPNYKAGRKKGRENDSKNWDAIFNCLNKIKAEFKERGLPDINIGSGVNTGTCIVGNMGSEMRLDYSVIGDSVNLAARLEAATRNYKDENGKVTPLLYPSFTYEKLKNIKSVEVDKIKVKGKEELITIYKPI